MPTIMVQSPPSDDPERAALAATLTGTAATLAKVPPEKVQIFFADKPGLLGSVEVHALDYDGAESVAWETAFRRALRYHLNVSVHLYPLDHAAKGGVLRSELARATPDPTEESQ
ncbi:MAG: hypothetical protein JSS97_12125 [Actinobacteria bacterium]|nr:hypothetical protein [Actinomycetota bacterium]